MKPTGYDFSGYVTRANIRCSDGLTIAQNAFESNDGQTVPLVWNHGHNSPENVVGHAMLETRSDGTYGYCFLNETENASISRNLIKHGDIDSMSIYANNLKKVGSTVVHGVIREVSLVLAGANPGAKIDHLSFAHGDGTYEIDEEEAIITTGDTFDTDSMLEHAEQKKDEESDSSDESSNEVNKEKDDNVADKDLTIKDVVDSMTEEQKNVLYFLIEKAVEEATDSDDVTDEGEENMQHNVFTGETEETLCHADIAEALEDAPRLGSLRESFIQHGIEHIDVLFPEAKMDSPQPELIARQMEWVGKVFGGVHKTPFSRVKSTAANLTKDDARAKGYIKGHQKVEEQFEALKRVTTPQTVYKLQKLDRDDIIDITDFDVVAWMKIEMRTMLDEEIARAILCGDGRATGSEGKISPDNIRPIYQDSDTYTIHATVKYDAAGDVTERSNALVEAAVRARKNYRGSGSPALYASNDIITDMLLATDKMGRRLYTTEQELAAALRVTEIVEVPVLEGIQRTDSATKKHELLGIIVNLADYTLGADKGGEVSMFDDFDLNYNKHEYLIETRASGALAKPYSAIALEKDVA